MMTMRFSWYTKTRILWAQPRVLVTMHGELAVSTVACEVRLKPSSPAEAQMDPVAHKTTVGRRAAESVHAGTQAAAAAVSSRKECGQWR